MIDDFLTAVTAFGVMAFWFGFAIFLTLCWVALVEIGRARHRQRVERQRELRRPEFDDASMAACIDHLAAENRRKAARGLRHAEAAKVRRDEMFGERTA